MKITERIEHAIAEFHKQECRHPDTLWLTSEDALILGIELGKYLGEYFPCLEELTSVSHKATIATYKGLAIRISDISAVGRAIPLRRKHEHKATV